ncbi:hypothetical protein OIU84_001676 [Salix udensis]|uniref:BHLH domain-containing protein n=1 Tax=Salix udensis TaxID=889485 RepID=A0AAD6P6W4_9ROSI|nr:hypothetical protein OIU84_001676 [Salix udensis]
MDPPLINENSFSAANPSSYSLTEIWPFPPSSSTALGLRMANLTDRDGSLDESNVTEPSGGNGNGNRKGIDLSSEEDDSSKTVSTTTSAHDLNDLNGKRRKISGSRNENSESRAEIEASSAAKNKPAEPSCKPSEPPMQDYIHVRARRGQATDSHSLAERARRDKISERMKMLQDLVPGCNKVLIYLAGLIFSHFTIVLQNNFLVKFKEKGRGWQRLNLLAGPCCISSPIIDIMEYARCQQKFLFSFFYSESL